MTAELNDGEPESEQVNHKRVTRVMSKYGLAGIRLRRRVWTTIPEPSGQKVEDLLSRDFTAEVVNTRYVGDITYLPLACGKSWYLATVISTGAPESVPGGRWWTICAPNLSATRCGPRRQPEVL